MPYWPHPLLPSLILTNQFSVSVVVESVQLIFEALCDLFNFLNLLGVGERVEFEVEVEAWVEVGVEVEVMFEVMVEVAELFCDSKVHGHALVALHPELGL